MRGKERVMTEKLDKKYRGILAFPHPEPKEKARMAREKRAAQFMPFAALTGFEEGIDEERKEQEARMEGG
jgi:hypothetical protein